MKGIIFVFLTFFYKPTAGFTIDNTASPGDITLYKDSHVVNMYDINMTEIYNSPSFWLVQFYSHWCGHCQRFAPIWKDLAEDVKDWSPLVRIAAFNCAEQSCDRYQIKGTPTLRIFRPNTPVNMMDSSYYGYDIPNQDNKEFYTQVIMHNIGLSNKDNEKFSLDYRWPVPNNNPASLAQLFEKEADSVEFIALMFDKDGFTDGKKVQLDMSRYDDVLKINRYRIGNAPQWGATFLKMVVVDRSGNVLETVDGWGSSYDRTRFTNILRSYVDGTGGVTSKPPVVLTSTLAATKMPPASRKDIVFQSDLERAVQYSLMTEVGNQPNLSPVQIDALIKYLDSLVNYFPNLAADMKSFLSALLQWVKNHSNNGYNYHHQSQTITSASYKAKVKELSEQFSPFTDLKPQWAEGGCAGSSPEKRGYPCSLWSLFHSLMASAADKDVAFRYGLSSSVATSMIGYIAYFFSCRDCARNFQKHVTQAQYYYGSPDTSLLWLWSIHNTANMDLAGDPTEVIM